MRRRYVPVLLALPLGFGISAAWGQSSQEMAMISIAGSERMVPFIQKLADRYIELHPDVRIAVEGGGSLVGLARLARAEITIASLARPANDREIPRVRRAMGKDPVGIPIAMDAVVFFVNRGNPLDALSLDQIKGIYTQRINEWFELGVPRERIHLLVPTRFSGSVENVATRVLRGKKFTDAIIPHKDRGELIKAVTNEPLAIGFAGMGDTRGVKVLSLRKDGDSPAVLPTRETIRDRTYPLAHYLYLCTAGQPTGAVKEFIGFAISAEGQGIIRKANTGAVLLPFSE